MIKLICHRLYFQYMHNIYICTYILYIVYILYVNPTMKNHQANASQHTAGYSLADGDRLIVVPDGTDCFTSGLGGSVIQR